MKKTKTGRWMSFRHLATLFMILITGLGTAAHATKLKSQNLSDLIDQSDSIISGVVKSVTDGFDDRGIPYTEITIAVGSSAKGRLKEQEDYTFRQFGLLKPRTNESGKTYLGATPAGFPKWHEDEMVIAFLFKPASRTGLQTTVGLAQGKFTVENGATSNAFGNAGLFENVAINPALLSEEQAKMMKSTGDISYTTFMQLIGDAVNGNWIENGDMK